MQVDIYMRNGKLVIIVKHQDDTVGEIMMIPFIKGSPLQINLHELVNTTMDKRNGN